MAHSSDTMADTRSFMRSRVILTAAELDFFTLFYENPLTVKELVEKTGWDTRATTRVLDCLITFDLLEKKEDGRYQTTTEGAFLSSRHPETVLPMVLHYAHVWNNWHHLTETVRRGLNAHRKSIDEQGEKHQEAFIGGMHVIGRRLSREIADSYDLGPYRRFLDVGGGSGTYSIAFLRKNPELRAVLFDQAHVIPLAEERFSKEGLRDRVELVAGDFHDDELPTGCDLVLLSAIIHQNSPQENVELYRKIHRALVPGGVFLIRDHIMDESRTNPAAGALFALNMLVGTEGGDTYTFQEVTDTLAEAGFTNVSLVRRGQQMDCLVEARKAV